jgi:hypothetical protein
MVSYTQRPLAATAPVPKNSGPLNSSPFIFLPFVVFRLSCASVFSMPAHLSHPQFLQVCGDQGRTETIIRKKKPSHTRQDITSKSISNSKWYI